MLNTNSHNYFTDNHEITFNTDVYKNNKLIIKTKKTVKQMTQKEKHGKRYGKRLGISNSKFYNNVSDDAKSYNSYSAYSDKESSIQPENEELRLGCCPKICLIF